jgi:hypothetical protein
VAATELSVSSLPTKGCELKGRGKIFAVLTIPLAPDMCLSYRRYPYISKVHLSENSE